MKARGGRGFCQKQAGHSPRRSGSRKLTDRCRAQQTMEAARDLIRTLVAGI